MARTCFCRLLAAAATAPAASAASAAAAALQQQGLPWGAKALLVILGKCDVSGNKITFIHKCEHKLSHYHVFVDSNRMAAR